MSMLRRVLDRESLVKSSLIESLIECVKELQLRDAGERKQILTNDETTNTFCWILEAIFIHGLKSRFLKSVSSALATTRGLSTTSTTNTTESQLPDPSFWEFILVFCHHEVIIQINKFNLIRTDIGRCRTWLRLALNDGLFISYLQLIFSDKTTVKDYYKPNAFLRDTEKCDILKSYLYGIESYEFQLACNSSLLNSWNVQPLSMVGLWVQTDYTISQGIDVAENMDVKDLQALPQLRKSTPPKHTTMFTGFDSRVPLLEEDEALRVILSSRESGTSSAQRSSTSTCSSRRNSDSSYYSVPPVTTPTTAAAIPSSSNRTNSSTRGVVSSGSRGSNNNRSQLTKVTKNLVEPALEEVKTTKKTKNVPNSSSGNKDLNQQNISKVPDTNKVVIDKTLSKIDDNKEESDKAIKCNSATITTTENSTIAQEVPVKNKDSNIPRISVLHQNSMTSSLLASTEEETSYAALFHSYNRDSVIGTPITVGSFLESQFGSGFGGTGNNTFGNETSTSSEADPALGSSLEENQNFDTSIAIVDNLGFEIIPEFPSNGQFTDMFSQISNYSRRIPFEIGIDVQNYKCKNCEQPIGLIYGAARICGLTGFYYCSECHSNDEALIPARILLNWDFGRYNVCRKAKEFLDEIMDQPLFNLKEINEKLYREVEECAELSTIRTKLQSISIYLRTCKQPIMHEFKKEIWPKDYLYEEIHSYSLSDLLNIPNRCLRGSLLKLVTLGKNHITSCDLCKLKGFVCEVCRDSEVIFPFDLEQIYKCSSCGAVYHKNCMNSSKPCPRCDRWKITA